MCHFVNNANCDNLFVASSDIFGNVRTSSENRRKCSEIPVTTRRNPHAFDLEKVGRYDNITMLLFTWSSWVARGPSNVWFDHSNSCNKLSVVGVSQKAQELKVLVRSVHTSHACSFQDMWKWKSVKPTTSPKAGYAPVNYKSQFRVTQIRLARIISNVTNNKHKLTRFRKPQFPIRFNRFFVPLFVFAVFFLPFFSCF